MTRISCSLSYITLVNQDGYHVDSVRVTCSRCGNNESAYGQSDASVSRALAELNENCPKDENNYYEVTDR